jgi:hypothetical protein
MVITQDNTETKDRITASSPFIFPLSNLHLPSTFLDLRYLVIVQNIGNTNISPRHLACTPDDRPGGFIAMTILNPTLLLSFGQNILPIFQFLN